MPSTAHPKRFFWPHISVASNDKFWQVKRDKNYEVAVFQLHDQGQSGLEYVSLKNESRGSKSTTSQRYSGTARAKNIMQTNIVFQN